MKETWNIHKTVITVMGMAFLFGIACIAAFVFGIDGKLLIGLSILIVGLANTDVLKLILPLLPHVTKYIPKNHKAKE